MRNANRQLYRLYAAICYGLLALMLLSALYTVSKKAEEQQQFMRDCVADSNLSYECSAMWRADEWDAELNRK